MALSIDWTTVIASALVSAIITSFNFLTTRYLARMLDKIERREQGKDNDKT
jgi:hypothetical protein